LQNQLIGSSLTALDAYKTIPTKIRQNVAHPACLMKRQSIVRNDAPQWECFHACPDQWEPRGTIKKNLDYAFFKWFITPPEVEWGCTSAAGKASGIAIAERKAFAFKHLARVHFPAELLDRVGEPFVSNEAMLIELVRTKHKKDSIATGCGLGYTMRFHKRRADVSPFFAWMPVAELGKANLNPALAQTIRQLKTTMAGSYGNFFLHRPWQLSTLFPSWRHLLRTVWQQQSN